MERRNGNRYKVNTDCSVMRDGARRPVIINQTENISGDGILIRWHNSGAAAVVPRVGESLKIEITLPSHPIFGQKSMRLKAKVVRVSPGVENELLVAGKVEKRSIGRTARVAVN